MEGNSPTLFSVGNSEIEPLRVALRVCVHVQEHVVLIQSHDPHAVQVAALEVRVKHQNLRLIYALFQSAFLNTKQRRQLQVRLRVVVGLNGGGDVRTSQDVVASR